MIYLVLLVSYLLCGFKFAKSTASSGEFPWYLLILAMILWLPVLILISLAFWKPVSWCIVKILGWKVNYRSEVPSKSITIVAPHTSWFDAVLGKMVLEANGIPHTILSASHLFQGPLKFLMKYSLKAIPIGGVAGKNAILEVAEYLQDHDTNIIICPEGHLRRMEQWNPGFWLMAIKSKTLICPVVLDYKAKRIIYDHPIDPQTITRQELWDKLREIYKQAVAKYPERFCLPQNIK